MTKEEISNRFKKLQKHICQELESLDRKMKFSSDIWQRPEGGGGDTRTIQNTEIIEKGGVNFSQVWGTTPQKILDALDLKKSTFFATGVSIVLHAKNPHMPIIHMNVRYFEMSNGTWWFGGGIDLTPIYVIPQQAKRFHQLLKETSDKFSTSFYPKFKDWADDYFFIKHRNETRGIGGIFFDRLNEESSDISKQDIFSYCISLGKLFPEIYIELSEANSSLPYGQEELNWQLIRRSRYVEYNLVYDKGTKFGLDTKGRTESILMSLPPMAKWEYNYEPKTKLELNTLLFLKKGINWLEIDN